MGLPDFFKSNSVYEALCVLLTGLGGMCMFTGYDTHSFILESVLHSVNHRNPTAIGRYAGYYGQAVDCLVYTVANLFAPLLIRYANPKWSLFVGSVTFTIYQMGFLFLNNYYFYISSAIMGIGFAMFYAGQGCYLADHSTKKNIERNFSMVWGIGCLCMVIGGLILLAIFESESDGEKAAKTRDFPDEKIRFIFGAFTLISLISNIIFLLLPTRKPENAIEDPNTAGPKKGFWDTLCSTFKTFTSPKLWMLSFSWIHIGLSTSFYLGPFPTTLIFSEALTKYQSLIPFYAFSVGVGEFLSGLIISKASKKIQNFGRLPTVAVGFISQTIAFILILLFTPRDSPLRPTKQGALLIPPNYYLPLVCGFLLGLSDGCWNTVRSCIVTTLMPDRRAQGFSLSKFFQSLASFALFLLSPMLNIYAHITILFISLIIGTITFTLVVIRAGQKERKIQHMHVVLNTRHSSWSVAV